MVEQQRSKIYYNCDEMYAPSHKCNEQKLFQIDVTSHTQSKDIIIEDTPKFEVVDHTLPM